MLVSYGLPLAWILGGIIVGVIAYMAIVRPLRAATARHGWHALETATSIIGTMIVLWGAIAGLYVGMDHFTLPAHTENLLDRAIGALFVFSLMWIAARIAGAWIEAFGARTDHKLFSVSLYSTLVQGAILVIGLLTVLSSMGIAIAPLLTTLGLGGLAVALALNDTLSNLFAGVQIVAARQLRIGDYVKFDFAEGEVVDIHWHNTSIRDFQNNVIIVPNSKINTAPFTNYSMRVSALMIPVNAMVPWKGPMSQLRAIAESAAAETVTDVAGKVESENAKVFLTAVNETNVQITALLPIGHIENRMRAVSGFLRRVYDGAREANMGLPLQA
ncbi:MAG TPA: mechanosensitive ion channel domain-containing protein [Candidatus Baltobacteraceae bacterium]|nr:mechanosensitive ion channel domain-containing protein [Candidatus Baltobacteraceae bacterium]